MVIRRQMAKPLFNSTFSQIFLGVTTASLVSLLIAWGANYVRVMDTFAQFASRQIVVLRGGSDVFIAEKRELPPEYQQIYDAYKKVVSQQFVTTLFVGLGISLFAGALISIKITRPLAHLKTTIQNVTATSYKIRAPEKGSLEMRELIASFNRLITELDDQEQLRQDLFADISHELNTPITKIRGQIEGMIDGVYPKDKPTLKKVLSNVSQLEFLIEALYQANRLTPQDVKLNLSKCFVKPLVDASISGLTSKPLTFIVKIHPKLSVTADKNRFKQILDNLITNAYKYTNTGTITIAGNKHTLTVTDTGPGIASENLSHIFDRLYRVDKSRNRTLGGLGLGLYITKKLANLHGWQISVKSQPGQGTTFTLHFTQSS